MFAYDTLIFTNNGFKTVEKLNEDDLVLTPFGTFTNIISIEDVEDYAAQLVFSTDECLICSENSSLPVYNTKYNKGIEVMTRVKNLYNGKYATTKTLPIINENKEYKGCYYKIGVDMPYSITDKMIIMSDKDKTDLMVGLLDTPLVIVYDESGVYELHPHSKKLERGMVSFFRSFGYPVECGYRGKTRYLLVGIQNLNVIDDIKYKDSYKELSRKPPDNRYDFMKIKDIFKMNKKMKMRKINVDGYFFVVGYSMIPFCSVN